MIASRYAYQMLHDVVMTQTGLQIAENRFPDILRAISHLEQGSNWGDVDGLVRALPDLPLDDPLWQRILANVTINETYFFRNRAHFDALQHHVLPPLITARRMNGQRYLRIWSAGSATGEEPYSIAILLREMLPDIEDWSITILATDINKNNILTAHQGVFKRGAFRTETREGIRDRWFEEADGGSAYRLHPVVRAMVQFRLLNLISDNYPSYDNNTMGMDLILCRNVTIYFDKQRTTAVVKRFNQALTGGGWLLVGHSEPQPEVYDAFETHILGGATFYRKPAELPLAVQRQPVGAASQHQPHPKPPKQTRKSSPAAPTVTPRPAAPDHTVDSALDPDTLWQQARQAADGESFDTALSLLSLLEAADMFQPQVYYLRGLIQIQMADLAAAEVALRQAIYCDPGFVLAHYTLGELAAQAGEREMALRHWQRARRGLSVADREASIPYEEGLTVEALDDLLRYRIANTEAEIARYPDRLNGGAV